MALIRNLLALIGLLAIIACGVLYTKFSPDVNAFNALDPGAKTVYANMWQKLKETGNSADATVVIYPLEEGVSWEDAEEAMFSVANEHNIKNVGSLPLSEQVQMMTGEDQRFLKIYQFCNPVTAMKMVDYSDAFSAYLPCRIAMVEGKDGQFVLYSLDMDMMIQGGTTLPPDLLEAAVKVKDILTDIMVRGSAGDF
ncbi:MAG: DUF302 domain-containing protein [Gammaproteobacteria bacterium]